MSGLLLQMTAPSRRRTPTLNYITDAKGQRFYTTRQAASYLGVTKGHIRKLASKGTLKPIKKGRDNLYTQAQLDRYQQARLPRGAQIKPTRSVSTAEERQRTREYMRQYRKRKKREEARQNKVVEMKVATKKR